MATPPTVNRLRGSLPKIGIRPAIDGRRIAREGLEAQTLAMARNVASLYERELRHPCGLPVECVIADTCIGGVAEAAACASKFEREGVGVSLTVSPCWCYGSETMDMNPTIPKAVWGFNGTERPGAVYLAAVLAAHNQKGLPAFSIYGKDVQDADDQTIPPDVATKLLRFARAGLAVATMRGKSYVAFGGVSMGIAGSMVNPDFFQDFLGMRNEFVDMSEFSRRVTDKIYDTEEFPRALEWVKKHCPEGEDPNPPHLQKTAEQKASIWEYSVKMAMIARDLMIGNPRLAELGFPEEAMGRNAIASGFQGQRHWTDSLPNGDFMETILCSSFDWNGLRQPFVVATENDCLNGVSMLFGHLLTAMAQGFSDVRTYWSPESVERVTKYKLEGKAANGIIHLLNSGATCLDATGKMKIDGKPAMKKFWEATPQDADACLAATTWGPAVNDYFRGGGFSSTFRTEGEMPLTLCRVNLIKGLGPVLQIAEGWAVSLPPEVASTLEKRTDRTWPSTWFAPRLTGTGPFVDVYSVMANWGANHGAFSYGHIGADLITFASMLRIPVCMHNVPSADVFRPHAWAAFGMDLEGADYRACATFGPLYR